MTFTILYKGIPCKTEGERPKACECCGKTPKVTQCHHDKYEFSKEFIRKHPECAINNTRFLCYTCHKVADCVRIIKAKTEIAKRLGLNIADGNS